MHAPVGQRGPHLLLHGVRVHVRFGLCLCRLLRLFDTSRLGGRRLRGGRLRGGRRSLGAAKLARAAPCLR